MPVLTFALDDRQAAFDKTFRIVKGALAPFLDMKIIDDGHPFPLTGATVTFSMDSVAGVAKVTAEAAALVEGGVTGIVRYIFKAAETDTPGKYVGQFSITLQSGEVLKMPNNSNQKLFIIIGDSV